MALPLDEFCCRLTASKVLSADEASAVLDSLAENERPTDGAAFAALLVKTGKLTSFQAQRLCEGKSQTLSLGNYVLLDRIGRGGMGDVFKALHRRMDRVVALKVVKPEILESAASLKRFQREVKTVAKLDHANIVTAYDADEHAGTFFLVMQFVDGRDLSTSVRQGGPFTVAKAVDCVLQAARGLRYAHEQGIVHRDVKPGNMLLDPKGNVKVLDLGLATLSAREARGNESLTGTETIIGTLDYMAPEQAQSARLADQRSDIYSLGMTLWFLLTGRPAYEGASIVEKLLAHRERPIPLLRDSRPDVPPELESIFARMVAKQQGDRYQSMDAVVVALETFQKNHMGSSSSTATGEAVEVTARWNRPSEFGGSQAASEPVLVQDHPARTTTDQTASNLTPDMDTTAIRNKVAAELPIVVSRTKRKSQPSSSWWQYRWVLASAAVGLMLSALAYAGIFFRVSTPIGTIVVEVDQPELAGAVVSVDGQQKLTIKTPDSPETIEVKADEQRHTLQVTKGGFEAFTKEFTVKAGKSETVRVRLQPVKAVAAANTPSPAPNSVVAVTPNLQSAPPGGYALEFNGKDSYVDLPTLRYDGSHPITLEATIVPYLAEGVATVIGDNPGIRLHFPGGGSDGIRKGVGRLIVHSTTAFRNVFSREAFTPRQRIHVVGALEGETIRLFMDGRSQRVFDLNGQYQAGRTPFRIGADQVGTGQVFCPFAGLIDELRISKVARYSTDFTPPSRFQPDKDTLALYHFDEGQGEVLTDSSGNNHHGRIVNAKWVPGIVGGPESSSSAGRASAATADGHRSAPGQAAVSGTVSGPDYALRVGDSGTRLEIPDLRIKTTGSWTAECWVTPHGTPPNGGESAVLLLVSNAAIVVKNLGMQGTKWSAGGPVTQTPAAVISGERVALDKRTHVAMARTADGVSFFVNGVRVGQPLQVAIFGPETTLHVCRSDPVWHKTSFQGDLDEIRVSKIARYTADFTPASRFEPDADTLALYHFDEGQGEVLTDSSGNGHHGKFVNAKWVPGIAGGLPAAK